MIDFDPKAVTLRADIFSEKKCVHIKLDKSTHSSLRALCFHKGISMQDIFEEFARSLRDGEKRSVAIIDKMIVKRLNLPKKTRVYKKRRSTELEELEKEALYDMIGNVNLEDEDVEDALEAHEEDS